MSSAASWSYTSIATVWPKTAKGDWGGQTTFGLPYTILCGYKGKGAIIADGSFVGKQSYYTEAPTLKKGDRILLGEWPLSDPIPVDAGVIIDVLRYQDPFDSPPADDYEAIVQDARAGNAS